jgi:hypothetical protein
LCALSPPLPGPRIHADDPTRLRVRHTPRDQPREPLPLGCLRRQTQPTTNHSQLPDTFGVATITGIRAADEGTRGVNHLPSDFSPDGKRLVFIEEHTDTQSAGQLFNHGRHRAGSPPTPDTTGLRSRERFGALLARRIDTVELSNFK